MQAAAVQGNKKKFYENVARTYAKKGSYFKRKDEIVREEKPRRNVKRTDTQLQNAGYFRIYRVEVSLERDLGKDYFEVSDAVLESTAAALGCEVSMNFCAGFRV